jgi:hypothetical protein
LPNQALKQLPQPVLQDQVQRVLPGPLVLPVPQGLPVLLVV